MDYGANTKVVNGALYARSSDPYAFDLRVHDLGHGHVEALAMPRYAWHEVDALSPGARLDWESYLPDMFGKCPPTDDKVSLADLEKISKRNRDRASRRARTRVRRLAKAKGLTVLLTLTYKENMLDRDRMARDFDVFVKRVRRVIPNFEYVCVFERQKRGAWHAHIAVPRVLSHYMQRGVLVRSYDLLRSMWRGVVGIFDGAPNGNVDVSRNKRVNRSSAKLATYLSKYIGKELGDGLDKWANSYSASGRALPDAVLERVVTSQMSVAMVALCDLLSAELGGQCEFHQALLDGGGWYVCLSPPDRGRPA